MIKRTGLFSDSLSPYTILYIDKDLNCFNYMNSLQLEKFGDWFQGKELLDELIEYIRRPSRSSRKEETKISGDYIINTMENIGMEVESIETSGNPVILGKLGSDSDNETVLIYGHYDVQPEGDVDLWHSPPFEPEIREGKLYGRGSADNKGQHHAHLVAIKYLKDHHPETLEDINIKIILDGNEEQGSYTLPVIFNEHQHKLDCDLFIVSDGPSLLYDRPTIVRGVRGILPFQITIEFNNEDLHSGNFGGLARSATHELTLLLSSMVDENGKCTIPGFHEDVLPASSTVDMDKLTSAFQKIIEAKSIDPPSDDISTLVMRHQFLPTFNINGLSAGGVNEERRTIIPQKAIASVDCRLVPEQKPEKIKKLLHQYIKEFSESRDYSLTLSFEQGMAPLGKGKDNPYQSIIFESVQKGFDTEPLVAPRLGGSLPLASFAKLDVPIYLIPYALPDENNHAPNENLDLEFYYSGIKSTIHLLSQLANR